jgi:hypothetical protein
MVKRLSTTDFTALVERLEQEVRADRGVDLLESIRRLSPQIEHLREQGVLMKDILALLNEQGLNLSTSTLRRYLQQIAKERRRAARARPAPAEASRTRAPQPNPPAPPTVHSPRPPNVVSLASKAPAATEGGRKEVAAPPATTGHFVPPPDSDRI